MKSYTKRRLSELVQRDRPKLFSAKGYLNDLDTMIQKEYVEQLEGTIAMKSEAMTFMLVELELLAKEKR